MRIVLGTAIALALGAAHANAGVLDSLKGLFGSGERIECEAVDAVCLTDYAADILGDTNTERSVNAYGKAMGRMWPHLAPETRDQLFADLSAAPEGKSLGDYVLVARAQIAPYPLSIDDLSTLLEHPDSSGSLPLGYYAETLVLSLLETDPSAVADLAVNLGDAFEATARDGLFRTIAWMAHNNLDQLSAYLDAYDPASASYFNVHQHLFAVAANSCAAGVEARGNRLRTIAESDLLRTRITPSERFALPMPALLACEDVDAALTAGDDLLLWLPKDMERLSSLDDTMAAQILLQRISRTVNASALTPLVRALHGEGREGEAETLVSQMLPLTRAVVSIDADAEVAVRKEEIRQTLDEILQPDDAASTSLDPVIALDWFNNKFDPEACCSPSSYAESIARSIVAAWPSAAARKAAGIALPLLDANEYAQSEAARLRLNIARRSLPDCVFSGAQLRSILDQIGAQKRGLDQVIRISDYLTYLDRREQSDTTTTCPDL